MYTVRSGRIIGGCIFTLVLLTTIAILVLVLLTEESNPEMSLNVVGISSSGQVSSSPIHILATWENSGELNQEGIIVEPPDVSVEIIMSKKTAELIIIPIVSPTVITVIVTANALNNGQEKSNNRITTTFLFEDKKRPKASITTTNNGPFTTSPINIQVSFSEKVLAFSLYSINVIRARSSNLKSSADGLTYYIDLIPEESPTEIIIDIALNTITDFFGNGNEATKALTILYHEPPYTTKLQCGVDETNLVNPIPFLVEFNTPVNGFKPSSIEIIGGTLHPTVTGFNDGTIRCEFSVIIVNKVVQVRIPAGVAMNDLGKENVESKQITLRVNNEPPAAPSNCGIVSIKQYENLPFGVCAHIEAKNTGYFDSVGWQIQISMPDRIPVQLDNSIWDRTSYYTWIVRNEEKSILKPQKEENVVKFCYSFLNNMQTTQENMQVSISLQRIGGLCNSEINDLPIIPPFYRIAQPLDESFPPSIKNCGDGNGKAAITFDDGPHENTIFLLDELKQLNIKATFFLVGQYIFGSRVDTVRRIHNEGHIVGDHSVTHSDFTTLTTQQLQEELEKNAKYLKILTGTYPQFIRPPYLGVNELVMQQLDDNNMHVAMVSADSKDYLDPASSVIAANLQVIIEQVKPKSLILLFHDTHTTNETMRLVVELLHNNNYEIEPLSDCFS